MTDIDIKEKLLVEMWKKNNVKQAIFEFDCGGDSMNSTEIIVYDNNDVIINDFDCTFLENFIYHNVVFYQNSDGHYLGEHGTVLVKLIDDKFIFNKNGISEYNETGNFTVELKVTDEYKNILDEYILKLAFRLDNRDEYVTSYKKDFIMTEDDFQLFRKKIDDIVEHIENYIYDIFYDNTNMMIEEVEDLIIEYENFTLEITYRYYYSEEFTDQQ